MTCESGLTQLDTYLDGELLPEEMCAFDAHLRSCLSCSSEALARVQRKRSVQAAGKRFTPSAEFRNRVQQSIAARPRRSRGFAWIVATATVAIFVVAGLSAVNWSREQARNERVFGEVADLHVANLASTSPVDVISSDRHTVKPWFQGKIPFAFDLPELQNSEFSLLGGRMTYLDQTPGAHLIYQVRKHEISVFIFQDGLLPEKLGPNSVATKKMSFNVETWSQGGLRYFVIGDAGAGDIDGLAKLLKTTGS
jgi:anti-sigma factor RsiW